MLDGLNFKEFVAFLSAFSPRTSLPQKIECRYSVFKFSVICQYVVWMLLQILFVSDYAVFSPVIFRVYDTDCNGKVAFDDILSILRDLTGSFMTEQQRQVCALDFWSFLVLSHVIAKQINLDLIPYAP